MQGHTLAVKHAHTETSMSPLLLTIRQTADQLGLGRTAIYDLMRQGKLEGLLIGSARRITRQSVEVYVRETLAEQAGGPADLSSREQAI